VSEIKETPNLPWQPQSFITGNLAIGNLRENLLRFLRTERGVHAETLLTAAGTLVGFAAQHVALLKGVEATNKFGAVPRNSIVLVRTKSGQQFLFGDWINAPLFPEAHSQFPLFGFLAARTIQAGVNEKHLPPYVEMVSHVSSSVGSPGFGLVRAPKEHQPQLQPAQLIKLLWPPVTKILRLPPPEQMRVSEPPLSPTHWPIIISIVASQFITQTKDTLDPQLGYALVMESAIIASKIWPELIQPGNWKLEPKNGELTITRLTN
jgi:hypothetical protein